MLEENASIPDQAPYVWLGRAFPDVCLAAASGNFSQFFVNSACSANVPPRTLVPPQV